MEYKAFYKNANRGGGGNRLKDNNSRLLKSKRESSRQDLHFTNRNLDPADLEPVEDEGILFRKTPAPASAKKMASEKKKRRQSQQGEEDKENELRSKYEDRLARLRKFKEDRAKAKADGAVKKKPFIAAAPKNVLLDRSYEKNLFKRSEADLKKMAEKRQVLTPAAKLANPRVDTRRREPMATAEKERPRRNIINVKTPASVKQAQPRVDTWRKEKDAAATAEKKREPKVATGAKPKTNTKINTATVTKKTVTATAVSSRKGVTDAIITGATGFTTYQKVRTGQKSAQFNFKFNNDGKMVTSTNRKKKSLEKLFRPNAPSQLQLPRFSPRNHAAEEDDVFAGISPIDVDTPTPTKAVLESEAIAMRRRETRRRSLIFTVEDVKEEKPDEWEPQVISISDDSDPAIEAPPAMNASFTIEDKQERILDRRPTIEETIVKSASPKLVGCGRVSLTGRPSLIFVEEANAPGVAVENPDATRIIAARIGFVEEHNEPTKPAAVQVFDSPKRMGVMSPSRRLSGTPRMSFIEEDIVPVKPLPEGNLATVLLSKQEGKRRSSGGSRRSSLVSFREEDQPPTDVREKVAFYYNLVDKELKRLQELCDLYKDDADNDEIDENSKGLIIAAQGQTNILINKKLSKFKDLVGHYERCWTDQKVRTDDLDGFWLMVSLDLENLDRRFEELRVLKENNWQEVVEQPKVKKIAGGGGIKKREKKVMKTKASGLADLIKKAREEAKRKKMMESALTETVTVVSPVKRSVRIATTPRRSSLARNSICTGCTPTSTKSKKTRKTIFNDHSLRPHETVKSILKIPSEKRRAKSVLFLDSGLDTPESHRPSGGGRKIVHTPKPKITFREEPEVEDVETISLTTPFKLDDEIRKRRRSSMAAVRTPSQEDAECCAGPSRTPKRKTLRFDEDDAAERAEAADRMGSPVAFANERKEKSKRARGKSRGKVSFV